MKVETLVKIKPVLVKDLLDNLSLDNSFLKLIPEKIPLDQLIELFIHKKMFVEMIKVLTNILLIREAIYWACLCHRETLGESDTSQEMQAITLSEKWIVQPGQELRWKNKDFADKLGCKTAGAWLSMSVFYSGGTISTDSPIPIPPTPGLMSKALSSSILLAACRETNPEKKENLYRSFVLRGLDVATGGRGDPIPNHFFQIENSPDDDTTRTMRIIG